MSYYSCVFIQCEEDAFDLFKIALTETSGTGYKPDSIKCHTNEGITLYTIVWYDVFWYSHFNFVRVFEKVMDKLETMGDVGGYGFKFIQLGEDNRTWERQNDQWENCCGELELVISVRLPDFYEEINFKDVIIYE